MEVCAEIGYFLRSDWIPGRLPKSYSTRISDLSLLFTSIMFVVKDKYIVIVIVIVIDFL